MSANRRSFLTRAATAGLTGLASPGIAKAFGRRHSGCTVVCAPPCPVFCLEPIHPYNLSAPDVNIDGPYPTLLRKAKFGELIQVRIIYNIVPPFPKCAAILADCIFCPVGVYNGPRNIGTGYLNAFVKAAGIGQASFSVRVSLDDGSTRDVPFAFDVST